MRILILVFVLLSAPAFGEERLVRLHAPQVLTDSGVFKFILPRFSLKTQVKVQLVAAEAEADVIIGAAGRPLFEGLGQTFALTIVQETAAAERFAGWLGSDVGKRTIYGYAPKGAPLFSEATGAEVVVAKIEMDGDALLGHRVSREACARCHAVDDETRKTTIGSTPSFFVLRSFGDWEDRFSAFYVLRPHGAFTQIEEVTEPFPQDRPSPIVPIELTLEEVEAVVAYVAALQAADLGAPLEHQ